MGSAAFLLPAGDLKNEGQLSKFLLFTSICGLNLDALVTISLKFGRKICQNLVCTWARRFQFIYSAKYILEMWK